MLIAEFVGTIYKSIHTTDLIQKIRVTGTNKCVLILNLVQEATNFTKEAKAKEVSENEKMRQKRQLAALSSVAQLIPLFLVKNIVPLSTILI